MGTGLIFPGPRVVTDPVNCSLLLDGEGSERVPGNSPRLWTVPQTNTGGQVENTQALERTMLKELGKMPP